MTKPIYLDYSANTPVDPSVLARYCQLEQSFPGNPNAHHALGRAAAEELKSITGSIAALLQVRPEEIIYTSGASESNNTAIKGTVRAMRHYGKHIISSPLEHPSVSGCLTALQEQGYEIDLVDITREGIIDVGHLAELLRRDTVLVTVSAVDSELGTVQPVSEISELLKHYPNCRLHVDATQAVGKIPLDFAGADTVSLTAHKFYGPNGVGLLLKRQNLVLEPLIHGGASTTLYRSGTPTLALDGGLEAALWLAVERQEERTSRVRSLNQKLRGALSAYPKVRINSPESAVPHILNLSVKGVKGTAFQRSLDEEGVCASVKSACSVEGQPSRAVFAVSRDRKNAIHSWRISLSHLTTEEELERFLEIFRRCYQALAK